MDKNYYDILGITEEEKKLQGNEFSDLVKKKFKKLSLKWHPDRWSTGTDEEKKAAEENFKEINEAKSVLEDPQKRMRYDNGGEPQFEGDPFGDFNPFDFFNARRPKQRKGEDIEVTVNLTFEEAYKGCKKTIRVPHKKPCSHCNGTGSEDKTTTTCPHCNGTGQFVQSSVRGNMHFRQVGPCPYCQGTGRINPHPCKHCNGTGFEFEYEDYVTNVPAGIMSGMTYMIPSKGEPIDGGVNGDLYVTVIVQTDNYFEFVNGINQINIIHKEEVPFNEAILGCDREIKLPNGNKETFHINECTKDNDLYTLVGKGYPDINGGPIGNFGIVIKYKYPSKLTEEQKEKLKNF